MIRPAGLTDVCFSGLIALGLEPYSVHSRTVVLFAIACVQLHTETNPIYIFIFIFMIFILYKVPDRLISRIVVLNAEFDACLLKAARRVGFGIRDRLWTLMSDVTVTAARARDTPTRTDPSCSLSAMLTAAELGSDTAQRSVCARPLRLSSVVVNGCPEDGGSRVDAWPHWQYRNRK